MDHALRVLEYEKLRQQLAGHAASSLGKELALKMQPDYSYDRVLSNLNVTKEATEVVRLRDRLPLGGLTDVRAEVKRAAIGSVLSTSELLAVAAVMYGGRQVKNFFEKLHEDNEEIRIPRLDEYADKLTKLIEVEQAIRQAIDDQGTVQDSASPQLRGLRTQLRSFEGSVRSRLDNILRNNAKMLSDAIVTIRNDRYVVPVKQEYRQAFGGIVHDQSASGQTLFIEPQAIVSINNEIQEVRLKERAEIERILSVLSNEVGGVHDAIMTNLDVLAELDFIFAKVAYGQEMNATEPKLNDNREIKLKQARHPFIPKDEVVPITVELGEDYTSLIITGPNTGGKTVTLKTIGLLQLMVQSGLYVPAEFGTELSVFDAVYADIGDEQSIEQSLSTFSSHMKNIVGMLDKIDFMSLVLFDELGAGTDPQEGAALAIAILDEVKRRGARVVATTHYSELKAYAYNREGVMNASMEFDIESLSPTYRLLIGLPGRSNAFEISRRLGLSEQVIDKARSHVGSDAESVESMINELEVAKQRAEQLEQELIVKRRDFEEEQAAFEAKMMEFERERDNLYSAAEAKAEKAVEQAKRQANEVIDRLKKLREQGIVKEHEIIAAKKELESAKPTLQEKKIQKVKQKAQQKRTFSKGEEVKVTTFNQKGYIVKQINDNEYNVQVGIMKVNVKADDLQKIGPSKEKELQSKGSSLKRQSSTKSELDLRGVRVEEGLMRLDKYIDEALVSGYDNVRIIHGLGTGAMRQATQEFLKGHRHVKSQRPGGMGEGGLGVTVVELK